ncbi:hypothetical protein ACMHYQ_23860, partial [Ectopseudomonas guguanensis]|uniref:hypothetical protein n=1 Tax=Ectopseudomonas guguanensis TaxID=1198456 RepID=UPI0039C12C35
VTKSAIRPGSNFNRQGGSIFHQRQQALEEAGTDTVLASSGAKRAKTGTPFFGYIIAATLENTDFGDFFHNQITTAWRAF